MSRFFLKMCTAIQLHPIPHCLFFCYTEPLACDCLVTYAPTHHEESMNLIQMISWGESTCKYHKVAHRINNGHVNFAKHLTELYSKHTKQFSKDACKSHHCCWQNIAHNDSFISQ